MCIRDRNIGTILKQDPSLLEAWKQNKQGTAKEIRKRMFVGSEMSISWIEKLLRGTNKAANDLADEYQLARFWLLPSS